MNHSPRPNLNISELTRAKLAGELILPLNQSSRRGPCLRKLVLWSNLLSASTTTVELTQEQDHSADHHGRSTEQSESSDPQSPSPEFESQSEFSNSSREQAEYDWFEHLMEEIDDSDSESESSDGTPDHPCHFSEPLYPLIHLATIQHPPEPAEPKLRSRSSPKRQCPSEHSGADLPRVTRRRRLAARSAGPPRGRTSRPRRRETSSLGLPHWGFLCVRPVPKATEDEDGHLPSLVPIKTRYRFESAAHHPLLASSSFKTVQSQPRLPLPSPSLNSIDFRPYDFIIATTSQLDGRTVQVKYLVGRASSPAVSSTSITDSFHDHDHSHQNRHEQYLHYQQQQDWLKDYQDWGPESSVALDMQKPFKTPHRLLCHSRQPRLLVTKLQLVLNHFFHPKPLDLLSPLDPPLLSHLHFLHSDPTPPNPTHQLAWKVFALRPLSPAPSSASLS